MWTVYERYLHGVRTFKTVEARNKVVRERQRDVENVERTVIGRWENGTNTVRGRWPRSSPFTLRPHRSSTVFVPSTLRPYSVPKTCDKTAKNITPVQYSRRPHRLSNVFHRLSNVLVPTLLRPRRLRTDLVPCFKIGGRYKHGNEDGVLWQGYYM